MRRRLPPPNWLRAFEAAARHLSFTGAAQELHVTQSAVSQQVKQLEHFLQQALFHRYPRRLELSDAGKAYLPVVHESFERLAAGTEELFGGGRDRVLTVKVSIAFATLWLASRLGKFQQSNPQLNLHLSHSIWLDESGWANTDLDIRAGKGQWPGLRSVRLTHDHLFPLCAPNLLQGNKPLRTPEDLVHQTLLITVGNEDGWPQWLAASGAADIETHHNIQLDTSAVAYEMAAAGAGLVLGRSVLAQDMLRSGRLVRPFDIEINTEEAFYLVAPEQRIEPPAAVAFRDWLLEELRLEQDESG